MIGEQRGDTLRQIGRLFGEGTVAGLSDARILERFLARGDETAFAALGAWLHRVARRVAVGANAETRRRRTEERRAGEAKRAVGWREEPRDDALVCLHEELDRLPERFRLPLVLCYLEGRTHVEAAA